VVDAGDKMEATVIPEAVPAICARAQGLPEWKVPFLSEAGSRCRFSMDHGLRPKVFGNPESDYATIRFLDSEAADVFFSGR